MLSAAAATILGPEFLEALLHHVAALHEFGGEVSINAARDRFQVDEGGQLVKVDQGGAFVTYGYLVAYNKKARIKGQALEPDAPSEQQAAPEAPHNGEVPEPAAVGPDPEQE